MTSYKAFSFFHTLFGLGVCLFLFYPPIIEQHVASFFDLLDDYDDVFPTFSPDNLNLVAKGGHFKKILSEALDSKEKQGTKFFEGWYYKLVTKNEQNSVIVIPGVFFDGQNVDNHAFIMIAYIEKEGSNIVKNKATYHKFPLSYVKIENLENDSFVFTIGKNLFSEKEVRLEIEETINGKVEIIPSSILNYKGTFLNPTIMGFFTYLDMLFGMQCVHQLVALNSIIKGDFNINNGNNDIKKMLTFNQGKAYIEKDYGTEFPSEWIWMASNHFDSNPNSSFLLSVAAVPIPNGDNEIFRFNGFLGFIYDGEEDVFYRFGSYSGAIIDVENFENGKLKGENQVQITITDLQYIYTINAIGNREKSVKLWAPVPNKDKNGLLEMRPFVDEMLNANFKIKIKRRSDYKIVLQNNCYNGGLEIQF